VIVYIVSCDLAKSVDYAAVCILRKGAPGYLIRSIGRLPRGTDYTRTAEYLRDMTREQALQTKGRPPVLVIDGTGVGAVMEDILRAWHLPLVSVKIHGGQNVKLEPGVIRVPKRDLILTLQAAYATGRLKAPGDLPGWGSLVRELQAFKVTINPRTRRDNYQGDGEHDDLVLSVAMGVFVGDRI